MSKNYSDFFKRATRTDKFPGGFEPMDWQCRLASGGAADMQRHIFRHAYLEALMRQADARASKDIAQ